MTGTKALFGLLSAILAATAALILVGIPSADAAFSGQNGNIVFQSDGDLWLTGPDVFQAKLTPNTPGSQEVDPSVSPDGRRVAFASNRDEDFDIFTLGIYTGTLTKVTNNSRRDAEPAWSRNSQRLAYESPALDPGRTDTDIWTKDADGTGTATDVTGWFGSDRDERAPSWSPAGNEIAFHESAGGDIWTWSTISGLPFIQPRTSGPGSDIKPNWSPDGSSLVFQSDRPAPDGTTDFEVYTVELNSGAAPVQLTDNSFEDGDAAYSPDGAEIAFIRNDGGNYDVFTMEANGTNQGPRYSFGSSDESSPDWGSAIRPPSGCTMGGTAFADMIEGTFANDTVCSLAGNDEVFGVPGSDTLKGGAGNDKLHGATGRDTLLGSHGRDTLDSRDNVIGNDSLNGGPGRDRCLKDTREATVRNCP